MFCTGHDSTPNSGRGVRLVHLRPNQPPPILRHPPTANDCVEDVWGSGSERDGACSAVCGSPRGVESGSAAMNPSVVHPGLAGAAWDTAPVRSGHDSRHDSMRCAGDSWRELEPEWDEGGIPAGEGQEGHGMFVPMHGKAPLAPQSAQEHDILVCSTLGRIQVSSSMGFLVPKNASSANSSASSGSGASSLRVSTSSFCSSQETLVDVDSDYRSSHRSERRKNFAADEIGPAVAVAAAAAADAADSATHDDSLVVSRASGRPARAARPGLGSMMSTHRDEVETRQNSCESATQTADFDHAAIQSLHGGREHERDAERARRESKEARQRERAKRKERREESEQAKEEEKQYYPADLLGYRATTAQAADAADAWRKTFGASSSLMPTDSYDFTMQLALWKIQQYR